MPPIRSVHHAPSASAYASARFYSSPTPSISRSSSTTSTSSFHTTPSDPFILDPHAAALILASLPNPENPTLPHGMQTLPMAVDSQPKTRKRISPAQLKKLEKMYKKDTHPSRDVREELSRQLNMELKSVTIWFQNKRQTMKRAALHTAATSINSGFLPSSSSSSRPHSPSPPPPALSLPSPSNYPRPHLRPDDGPHSRFATDGAASEQHRRLTQGRSAQPHPYLGQPPRAWGPSSSSSDDEPEEERERESGSEHSGAKRSLDWACAKTKPMATVTTAAAAAARRTSADGGNGAAAPSYGNGSGSGSGGSASDSRSARWDRMSKKDEMDAALALCRLLHGVA
ncbi:hypothetical protein BOTBODRAFT_56815 [Botryobasidium botryosum FD-172 SS1]|uniref:Homeobox domain-containing protein n=1 Tax=Botryobasidium botryosum (strain FD-172 SS1) TaxID=930990 RepID=A0A067M9H9_BOTB1|nr:hypothetical protein BOTBODRAFT_56815 [Botryobasidium botryosum FD-172 SS1]